MKKQNKKEKDARIILKKRGNRVILKPFFILFLFVMAVLSVSFASALTSNVTQSTASLCLNESRIILQQMIDEGLNILRINDSLNQATSLYDAQVVLLEKKGKTDFSLIMTYCDEIKKIREDSTSAVDEFNVLVQFYNISIIPAMDTSTIDLTMNEIRQEIKNERYENVKPLIDRAYNEIIDTKSSYTALNLFISSTSRGFVNFIIKHWKTILILVFILIVLFLIYRIKIMKMIVTRQIERLALRKKTLQDLIMKTQKDYFETGKIPESEYNIKIKKFAELIRDIDRQIPLLREDLMKLEKRKIKKV